MKMINSNLKNKHTAGVVVMYVPIVVIWFIMLPLISTVSLNESSEPINFHYLPGVNDDAYSDLGDINIGAISVVLEDADTPAECSRNTKGLSYTSDTTEAVAFAVGLVNRDPDLLPNITLGFVMKGICPSSPNVALATSLVFLPRSVQVCNLSTCFTKLLMTPEDTQWHNHDVIGVITPGFDPLTTMMSSLYSVAHLPMVGATEISDELSNKDNHPYFFRIVPPSRHMIQAMLKFISMNDWSYISIIYQEGPYGQKAYDNLKRNADRYGICIATSHMIIHSTKYIQIIDDILKYPRARVVVLFVVGSEFRQILQAINERGKQGHFIFVAGDAISDYSGYQYVGRKDDPGLGTFIFDLYFNYVNDFYSYLLKQDVETTKNPWLKGAFEYILECSYDKGTCRNCKTLYETYRYRTNKATNLRIDAVLTLAHAAHDLLKDQCPDARGADARACISGELLRQYLKETDFEGYNNRIHFDENQDEKGKIMINQFVYDHYRYPFAKRTKYKHMSMNNVAVYDTSSENVTYLNDPTWSHVTTLDRIVPWSNQSLPLEIPESVCSRPCVSGEYKIERELVCCWECFRCRDNERLVEENTSCEACPPFTWPDLDFGLTTCKDITPTYPTFQDPMPITLTCFAIVCLIINVCISVTYLINGDKRVIKASSKESSIIELIAIFIGYSTVVLLQTAPTDVMCTIIFYMFCMSFAMLYCPLLVKTIRIVRIFQSGMKNEKPRFINRRSQLLFTATLIFVQGALCVVTHFLHVPGARPSQSVWSEKLVELSCDLTLPGLTSFLCYNMVLVSFCSVFAFKVRKLPDNFNESQFISLCVSATLLIWLAFTPTYFTATRQFIRVFLISTALLLNHSVALALLFLPKIYAALFLNPDEGSFSNIINRSS